MNTNQLKKFAKEARIKLITQIGVKLDFVLTQDTAELRGKSSELGQLRSKLSELGREQLIETVAYTWFNRIMALRFMDANDYNTPKVVTPLPGMSNPEILQNALAGNIEEDLKLDRQRLNDLIDGRTSNTDAQTEAFKMLLVASCNKWHLAMPFIFERISDYTELLLPDDLLSDFSIISDIRNGMSGEDCQQEELIGWLYQFYISDKKDDVFEGLKKNIKITPENIPAATQLFTPRWIVRYMVENTLGKLWLTFKPASKLRQHMPYFIDSPEGNNLPPLPENIKGITDVTFLDPCQGSGHVLVYAFELFSKIYEEEGYNTNEIPSLILKNNLFGIDIDERAAQLAAFALTMKARNYYSRFLRKPVLPNVIALENVNEDIIKQTVKLPLNINGKIIYEYSDLTLFNLTHADNFGSLIQIKPEELNALQIHEGSIWETQELKLKAQAEFLSKHYHCVATNPPYMGVKGMNDNLKNLLSSKYQQGKADLYTAFILRCQNFLFANGYSGMVTMESWMFLSSFIELRKFLLENTTIHSLSHFGWHVMRIAFGTCSFIIQKTIPTKNNYGVFSYLEIEDIDKTKEIPLKFPKVDSERYSIINQNSFIKIPGSPIGYWISNSVLKTFEGEKLNKVAVSDGQNITGNNAKYIRFSWEVEKVKINPKGKWPLIAKGGEYRKWFGNIIDVIDWSEEARDFYKKNSIARIQDEKLWFRKGITWNLISSGEFGTGFRILEDDCLFNKAAPTILFDTTDENELYSIIGFLNSKLCNHILEILNPTYNTNIAEILSLPLIKVNSELAKLVKSAIEISREDWNRSEISFNFQKLDLLKLNTNKPISELINLLEVEYKNMAYNLYEIEKSINLKVADEFNFVLSNNKAFSIQEITILKNELNIKEEINVNRAFVLESLISYSIGCLMGRFSLDKDSFILANQGESLQDYLKQIPNPSFIPDEDNIIPVLDDVWFSDDIVGIFKVFIKVAFGEDNFEDNLRYIEEIMEKDIRKYFVKDFYSDHIRRFKKRPIYWMFSSPKGHFKALIYMHRYQPDLCSKMLNDYLQPYISKLEAAKQTNTLLSLREDVTAREKTIALKEVDRLELMIRDCKDYERTLFTIATQKITIDLDEGVKVNYLKLKDVLEPIKGLEKEEN